MKHTKGEWKIDKGISYYFVKSGENRIAMIDSLEGSALIEYKANAKLIAAAPELLEALKTIKGAFYSDGESYKEQVDDLKAIANEAIKKATQ